MLDSEVHLIGACLDKPPMIPLTPWWRRSIKGVKADKGNAGLDRKVIVAQTPGRYAKPDRLGLFSPDHQAVLRASEYGR